MLKTKRENRRLKELLNAMYEHNKDLEAQNKRLFTELMNKPAKRTLIKDKGEINGTPSRN